MSAYYEPGDYLCKIVGQGLGESKEKKTPFVFLTVRPVAQYGMTEDGEQEYQVDAQYDRTVNLWLSPKTVERAAQRLVELGWQGTDWNDLAPGGACNLEGTEVRLTCLHENYNDQAREKWDFPFGGAVQHDPSVGKKLNALFGKSLKKPAKQPIKAAATNGGDDDLPF